jgi:hypothetical protein
VSHGSQRLAGMVVCLPAWACHTYAGGYAPLATRQIPRASNIGSRRPRGLRQRCVRH